MTTYSSQIPAVAAEYFPGEHPAVTQIFRPGKGWTRLSYRKYVSHSYLVQVQAEGVTSVVLSAGGRDADFSLAELVGKMGAVDAEMTDGVPLMENTTAVRNRHGMAELLIGGLQVDLEVAMGILDEVDRSGRTEFVREERGFSAVDPRGQRVQGWRYRMARHSGRYELTVLVHETS